MRLTRGICLGIALVSFALAGPVAASALDPPAPTEQATINAETSTAIVPADIRLDARMTVGPGVSFDNSSIDLPAASGAGTTRTAPPFDPG